MLRKIHNLLRNSQAGQSIIELLVAMGLSAILLPAFILAVTTGRDGKAQQQQRLDATTMLQQTQTAIQSAREAGWSSFAVDGTYHPIQSGTTWALSSGADTVNGFNRAVVISDVYRDSTGAIATNSGTLDPSTKKVTTTLSWNTPYPSSLTSVLYLTRYQNNTAVTQTTVPDFTAGVASSASVIATTGSSLPNDGQVQLNVSGNGNWCQPQNNIVTALTLPKKGNSIQAAPNAAYVGTGDGTTNSVTFANIKITDPPAQSSTPSATLLGTFSSNNQTNAIYSDGHYAYLATNNTTNQVVILDISALPYTQIGTITIPTGSGANGIYVSGNTAYVTSSNQLYSYNITTKTGTHSTPLASVSMWLGWGATPLAKQVVVVGNYAFVGTADTLFGLQKFLIQSNGTGFKLVGVSNLTWNQSAQGLYVNSTGTRAYVAFDQGGFFSKGFFIVDTSESDPPSYWPFPTFYDILGSYNVGSTDPTGMTVVSGNRAIVVGNGGSYQYQVIDISNENNPVFCGGLAISNGIGGVASILESGNAYSYILTGEARDQFKIILGGVGGQTAGNGTFESSTIVATNSAAFNNITAHVSQPTQSTIKMQVASSPSNSGSCTGVNYSYVGPGGDPNQYFTTNTSTISGTVPFGTFGSYQNPGGCFRYKVFMNSQDSSQTPVLYDTSVNYSP